MNLSTDRPKDHGADSAVVLVWLAQIPNVVVPGFVHAEADMKKRAELVTLAILTEHDLGLWREPAPTDADKLVR